MVRLLRESQSGQVALETLSTFFVWIMTVSLFFNLLFYLGSVMLMDSALNRAATQIGSYSCIPTQVDNYMRFSRGLGVLQTNLRAVQINNENSPTSASSAPGNTRGELYYRQGTGVTSSNVAAHALADLPSNVVSGIELGGPRSLNANFPLITTCNRTWGTAGTFQRDSVPNGRYIWIQLNYRQNLWMFGTRTVRRNVLVVSSGLTEKD